MWPHLCERAALSPECPWHYRSASGCGSKSMEWGTGETMWNIEHMLYRSVHTKQSIPYPYRRNIVLRRDAELRKDIRSWLRCRKKCCCAQLCSNTLHTFRCTRCRADVAHLHFADVCGRWNTEELAEDACRRNGVNCSDIAMQRTGLKRKHCITGSKSIISLIFALSFDTWLYFTSRKNRRGLFCSRCYLCGVWRGRPCRSMSLCASAVAPLRWWLVMDHVVRISRNQKTSAVQLSDTMPHRQCWGLPS